MYSFRLVILCFLSGILFESYVLLTVVEGDKLDKEESKWKELGEFFWIILALSSSYVYNTYLIITPFTQQYVRITYLLQLVSVKDVT